VLLLLLLFLLSRALPLLEREYLMHETLREERFYVREALLMMGPMMVMKHGGHQTLASFMEEPLTQQQLQHNLRRAAYEVFSCIHACHKHQIVHRVSTGEGGRGGIDGWTRRLVALHVCDHVTP
jgi:hypothetical protein